MADFNFEIDFLLQTSRLAADLAKIEKSTTQSADQLAKVWKDAFSKINLGKAFDTKDIKVFGDQIRDTVAHFDELAQAGKVPMKILNSGFQEVAKNVTAAMKTMKLPKELKTELMAQFKTLRSETDKLLKDKNKANKVTISTNIEELLTQFDALSRRIENITKKKAKIEVGGFEAAGQKLANASSAASPVVEKSKSQIRSENAKIRRDEQDAVREANRQARQQASADRTTVKDAETAAAKTRRDTARAARETKAQEYRDGVEQRKQENADKRAKAEADKATARAKREREAEERALKAGTKPNRAGSSGGGGSQGGSGGANLTDAINFLAFSQFSSALSKLSRDMLGAAAQMEQFQRRFSIVSKGGNTSNNFQFLKDYAAKSPFDIRDVMTAGVSFAAQEKTMKKLGRDFQGTVRQAGELGSLNPEAGIVDAQKMYSRIMAGDSNGLEIARSQFAISNDMLADNGAMIGPAGVSISSIAQRKKVLDAIDKFILDTTGGKGASGQAETLAGKLSNLGDQSFQTMASVMEPLVPYLKDAVVGLTNFLKVIGDFPAPFKLAIDSVVFGIAALATAATVLSAVSWGSKALGLGGLLSGGAAAAGGQVAGQFAGKAITGTMADFAGLGVRKIASSSLAQTGLALAGTAAYAGANTAGIPPIAPAIPPTASQKAIASAGTMISRVITGIGAALTSWPVVIAGTIAIVLGVLGAGIEDFYTRTKKAEDEKKALDDAYAKGHLQVGSLNRGLKPGEASNSFALQRYKDNEYLVKNDATDVFIGGNQAKIESEREKIFGISVRARKEMADFSLTPKDPRFLKAQSDSAAADVELKKLKGRELTAPMEDLLADNLDKLKLDSARGDDSALGKQLVELTRQVTVWNKLAKDPSKNPMDQRDFAKKAREAELAGLEIQKQVNANIIAFQHTIIGGLAAVGKLSYARESEALSSEANMTLGMDRESRARRTNLQNQAAAVDYKAEQEALQTTVGLMKYRYGEEKMEIKSLTIERDKELVKFQGEDEKSHQARKAIWEKYAMLEIAARQKTLDTLTQMERAQIDIVNNIKANTLNNQSSAAQTTKDILMMRMDNKPYNDRAVILKDIEKVNKSIEKSMQNQLKQDITLINQEAARKTKDIKTKLNNPSDTTYADPKLRQQAREDIDLIEKERASTVESARKKYSQDKDKNRETNKNFSKQEIIKEKTEELDAQYKTMEAAKAGLEFQADYNDLAKTNKQQYITNLKEQYELEKAMLAVKLQKETDPELNPQKSQLELMADQKQNRIDMAQLQIKYLDKLKETTNELDRQLQIKELQKKLDERPDQYGVEDLNQRMKDESNLFRMKAGFGFGGEGSLPQGQDHGNNPYSGGQQHGGKGSTLDAMKARFGMDDLKRGEFGQYSSMPTFKNIWEGLGADNIQGRINSNGSFQSTMPSIIGNLKGDVNVNVNVSNGGRTIGKKSDKVDVLWSPYNNDVQPGSRTIGG